MLTAHAAKGLEWDVVVVAGVQEGLWPDLRLRGSVLGSEDLVDLAAGREHRTAAQQLGQLLDEERRLFYVAVTRARRRLVVTAVDGDDGDQPSRFLDELDPRRSRRRAPSRARSPTVPRTLTLPALVAELRGVLLDRDAAAEPRRRAAAASSPAGDGTGARRRPAALVGPAAALRRPAAAGAGRGRAGLAVQGGAVQQVRAALDAGGRRAAPDRRARARASARSCTTWRARRHRATDPAALHRRRWTRLGRLDLGSAWYAAKQRDRAWTWCASWPPGSRRIPRRLVAVEREFEVKVGRAWLRGRVDRLERDADGRLVVVDLKTGSSAPKEPSWPSTRSSASTSSPSSAARSPTTAPSPAARRWCSSAPRRRQPRSRASPRCAEDEDPAWAERAGPRHRRGHGRFGVRGRRAQHCRTCPVRRAARSSPAR